jgi:hypothetical protein
LKPIRRDRPLVGPRSAISPNFEGALTLIDIGNR